jgi:hypothetical protein
MVQEFHLAMTPEPRVVSGPGAQVEEPIDNLSNLVHKMDIDTEMRGVSPASDVDEPDDQPEDDTDGVDKLESFCNSIFKRILDPILPQPA